MYQLTKLLCRQGVRAFLLINVACTLPECASYGRMFDKDQRPLPDFVNDTLSAAFFDIKEDVSFVHCPCGCRQANCVSYINCSCMLSLLLFCSSHDSHFFVMLFTFVLNIFLFSH